MPSPSFCFAWGSVMIKCMQFLDVKNGKEMMMMMTLTRFGTRVHSYINVQPLHLTLVPFALPKALPGVQGERKPGLPLSQQHGFPLRKQRPGCWQCCSPVFL